MSDETSESLKTMGPLFHSLDKHLREAAEGKTGIFRDHRCRKCDDGARPCAEGAVNRCGYPRARND